MAQEEARNIRKYKIEDKGMRQSFREYITSLGRLGWVVVGVILAGVGGYLDIFNAPPIPKSVWLTLALVVLMVAPFLAFHKVRLQRDKLRNQLDDKSRKQAIKDTLGRFLDEGRQLQRQCANENEPPPSEEADDWAARVEAYLIEHLGQSYVSRFRSPAGLPMAATSISSVAHRNLWGGICTRLSRLDQFIGEITG